MSSLAKLGLHSKPRPFRVLVLGQSGVGKSALVVRFITRRFIGEYDPKLEKIYTFQTVIDNEIVCFEILDSAGIPQEGEYQNLENNIKWAEAFVLMYSVTDKCSFDECHRLKFLINYNKRRRRLTSSIKDNVLETPVILVANKTDQIGDRMVSTEEGQRRCKDIRCVCFHEISVRESIDQVINVFSDVRRFWRVSSRWPRHRHMGVASSDGHPSECGDYIRPPALVPSLTRAASDPERDEPDSVYHYDCQNVMVSELDGVCRSDSTSSCASGASCASGTSCASSGSEWSEQFRARASTESRLSRLLPRPLRARHPPAPPPQAPTTYRRMSVAMRGNNSPRNE